MQSDNITTGPIVTIHVYNLLVYLAEEMARMSKLYRYSYGRAIDEKLLEIIALISEANSIPRPLREPPLVRAKAATETVIYLLRLMHELKAIETKTYLHSSEAVIEIQKELAGWISYIRSGPYYEKSQRK